VIDRRGRLAEIYEQQMAYASVPQQAQVYARELSRLLVGHTRAPSNLSYAAIEPIAPAGAHLASACRRRHGSPGHGLRTAAARVLRDLAARDLRLSAQLQAIGGLPAARDGRPPASVDCYRRGQRRGRRRARSLRSCTPSTIPLAFAVGIDRSGRIADGYEVQDQPWFVLTSRTGPDPLVLGRDHASDWPTPAQLAEHVGAALSAPPNAKAPTQVQDSTLLAGLARPARGASPPGG